MGRVARHAVEADERVEPHALQALIALGLPAVPAQLVAGLVWLAALAASAWLVRGHRLSFAVAFAMAFALLSLGRPVGWTLVYLDVVVYVAAWPSLPRLGRAFLLVGVVALLLSHWAALVLTGLGEGQPLLTLQPADRPWETWVVLPLAWTLGVWAARRLSVSREVVGTDGARIITVGR